MHTSAFSSRTLRPPSRGRTCSMCGRMVGSSLLMHWKDLMAKSPKLTTDSGAPVADNQNSLTAGPFGPVLIQDFHLLEKLAHQNRERIPERTVHAKGSGALRQPAIGHQDGDLVQAFRPRQSACSLLAPWIQSTPLAMLPASSLEAPRLRSCCEPCSAASPPASPHQRSHTPSLSAGGGSQPR